MFDIGLIGKFFRLVGTYIGAIFYFFISNLFGIAIGAGIVALVMPYPDWWTFIVIGMCTPLSLLIMILLMDSFRERLRIWWRITLIFGVAVGFLCILFLKLLPSDLFNAVTFFTYAFLFHSLFIVPSLFLIRRIQIMRQERGDENFLNDLPSCSYYEPKSYRRSSWDNYPSNWKSLREQALLKANYQCARCRETEQELHVHHIIPISQGGSHDLSNLEVLCASCHFEEHPGNPWIKRRVDQDY